MLDDDMVEWNNKIFLFKYNLKIVSEGLGM